MELAEQLAETLRRLRQDAGLTQGEMAKRLGVSRPSLNRLESNSQNITLQTLSQLCRALHCQIGDLFCPGKIRLPRQSVK